MNSSDSTTRSAPSALSRARALRAFTALPSMSPTVGLSWASVILNSVMGTMVPCAGKKGNWLLQIAPMRSAMANSQNRPAMIKVTPTAAEPMSLTRPICGSWSVVRRSASFSIAVLSSSTIRTSTTAANSSTRRMIVAPTSHDAGIASTSATSSSRIACSDLIAKMRPLRELSVARQNLSKSETRHGRDRFDLAAALLLEQFGDQEGHVDRLLGVEPGIARRVITVAEILVADGARATDALGDVLPGHFQVHAAGMGALGGMNLEERLDLGEDAVERP